jgi:DNA-binding transcriptional ArsR family regulator
VFTRDDPYLGVDLDVDQNGDTPRSGHEYSIPFRRAKDVVADLSPDPDWIVTGILEPGLITILSGPPFIGKSTLAFNLFALMEQGGGQLLGLDVRRVSYLLLTEEPARALQMKMFETGLTDFEMVSKRDVNPELPWSVIVRDAITRCVEVGHDLLVIDSLPAWAGIPGDKENNSGEWYKALDPLRNAPAGIAILPFHHDRKSGGRGSQAGRGSNTLAAVADIWVQITRSGNEEDDEERVLLTESRIGEPLRIHFTKANGVLVPTDGPERKRSAPANGRVLDALAGGPATVEVLAEVVGTSPKAVRQHLRSLHEEGQVVRSGAGVAGDPHVYAVAPGGRRLSVVEGEGA